MPDDFDTVAEAGLNDAPEPEEADLEDAGEGEGGEAEAAPPAAAGEEPAPEAPTEPWRAALRTGETPEQAIPRLVEAITRRKGETEELRNEIASLRSQVEPAAKILHLIQERQRLAELAERESALPDPELEPERAALTEIQDIRRMILEDRRLREEAEQRHLTEAEERQRQEAIAKVDSWAETELASGLGLVEGTQADPEFADAFQYQEAVRWQAIVSEYGDELAKMDPQEAQAKATQALELMRRIDGRKAAAVGKNPRDLVLARYRATPETVRAAMKAHLAAQNGAPAGNSKARQNGHGRPTAAQIEREASRAARGAGVRRTTGGGAVAPPMGLEEYGALSEEEQLRLVEAGKLSDEDLFGVLADPDWGQGV